MRSPLHASIAKINALWALIEAEKDEQETDRMLDTPNGSEGLGDWLAYQEGNHPACHAENWPGLTF